MAHVRRKGTKWQAIITLPNGRQFSRTDPLKKVVDGWAKEEEAKIRRGTWSDPRPARSLTVAAWREEWVKGRVVETVTRRKDDSHWRQRVQGRWGDMRLSDVRRSEVQEWVVELGAAGVGAHSVAGAINHLGTLLQAAVEAEPPLIATNPARGLTLPRTDAGRLRFLTPVEYGRLDAELPEPHRTLVEMACFAGLRWGELSGLDALNVDLARGEVHVRQVLTRTGLRSYAKSAKSHRTVPLTGHLMEALAPLVGSGLVFHGPDGQEMDESNYRQRVWRPAMARAKIVYAPPHTTRHTAASWLVMAGVDLYRVQALLGHESYRTTEKYAHLAPDAHDAVRQAWAAMDATPYRASIGQGEQPSLDEVGRQQATA